jgi:hypothetical protein
MLQLERAAGRNSPAVCPMVVGPGNSDPYPEHRAAIEDLGRHFGLVLDRTRCFCNGPLVVKLQSASCRRFLLLPVVGAGPPLHAV